MDEIALILWLQNQVWLRPVMGGLSFLGTQEFFVLAVPLVFCLIGPRSGVRVGAALLLGQAINTFAKLGFHLPRPYWVDGRVQALATEPTYGLPSGHAQTLAVWLYAAARARRRWFWIVAVGLPLLVGVSRIQLGVHFAGDVVAGWLVGGALALGLIWLDGPVSAWLARRRTGEHVGLAAAVAALILLSGVLLRGAVAGQADPATWANFAVEARALDGFVMAGGGLFGLWVGIALAVRSGATLEPGSWRARLWRLAVASAGGLALYAGLKAILPTEPEPIGQALRFVRAAATTFWLAYVPLRLVGAGT